MNTYSLSIIAPTAERDSVNAALELLGYGPQTLTVPIFAETAPDSTEPPTHYGCHWWTNAATVSALDAIRATTLAGCQVLIRCPAADVIPTGDTDIEGQSGTPEPTGTFGAVRGDFIEVRHKQFAVGQWGWRAEMRSQSGDFEPGVRAIGIYSDAACTQYLYTTGAFVLDAESGRYVTEWNVGDAEKATRYFALLYASLQEAIGALLSTEDVAVVYLKYGLPAEPPPVGETWVDTGATITGQAGQLFYVSLPIAGLGLIASQAIRIGPTLETTFVQVWPGTTTLMQINPYVAATAGMKVWKWA